MFPACHQSADTSSSNETTTRLLVSGHASMEDLWALFSSFGAVSSIVLVEGGAKVNFLQEETLSKFYQSGEIAFGAERLVVTKIKERKGQESLSMRFSLPPPPPPPPAPAPSPVQSDWSLTAPPPLTFTPLVLQPHLALPPFSPQYEASVVRSPQPTPPAQHQPEIFTFDTSSFLETESVCPVPRQEHFLQPLTPLTPGPLPPLPPAQKTCQANSFFFPPSCSSDSSDTARPSTVFSSPYKKFVKFKGAPSHPEFPLRNNQSYSRHVDYTGVEMENMENVPGSFYQDQDFLSQPILQSPRPVGVNVASEMRSESDILQKSLARLSLK